MRKNGGLNAKLLALTDQYGRQLRFFVTAGQFCDYTGAAALFTSFPETEHLRGDRGYDPDWIRYACMLRTADMRFRATFTSSIAFICPS